MAYTPTVWETGDTITAEKLNKAEQGIAAANILPTPTENDVGSILMVGGRPVDPRTTIVPEQTVVDDGQGTGVALSNVTNITEYEGQIEIIVNDDAYICSVGLPQEYDTSTTIYDDEHNYIGTLNYNSQSEAMTISFSEAGTYVVSVDKPTFVPEYQLVSH